MKNTKICIVSIEDEVVTFKVYNSDVITHADHRVMPLDKFLEWMVGMSIPCGEIPVEEIKEISEWKKE